MPDAESPQALGTDEGIGRRLRGWPELRAIATAAVPRAANGRDFVSEAWRRHRVRLEVVAAEESRGSRS